jgi:hypothetical protein
LPSQQLPSLKAYILCRSRLKSNLHSCSLNIYFGWYLLRSDGSTPVFHTPTSSAFALSDSPLMVL